MRKTIWKGMTKGFASMKMKITIFSTALNTDGVTMFDLFAFVDFSTQNEFITCNYLATLVQFLV